MHIHTHVKRGSSSGSLNLPVYDKVRFGLLTKVKTVNTMFLQEIFIKFLCKYSKRHIKYKYFSNSPVSLCLLKS